MSFYLFGNRTAKHTFVVLMLILPHMGFSYVGTIMKAKNMDRGNAKIFRTFTQPEPNGNIFSSGIIAPMVQSRALQSSHHNNPQVDEETDSMATKLGWIGFSPMKSTEGGFGVMDIVNPEEKTAIQLGPGTMHSADFGTEALTDILRRYIFNAKALHQEEKNVVTNDEEAYNELVSEVNRISSKMEKRNSHKKIHGDAMVLNSRFGSAP